MQACFFMHTGCLLCCLPLRFLPANLCKICVLILDIGLGICWFVGSISGLPIQLQSSFVPGVCNLNLPFAGWVALLATFSLVSWSLFALLSVEGDQATMVLMENVEMASGNRATPRQGPVAGGQNANEECPRSDLANKTSNRDTIRGAVENSHQVGKVGLIEDGVWSGPGPDLRRAFNEILREGGLELCGLKRRSPCL